MKKITRRDLLKGTLPTLAAAACAGDTPAGAQGYDWLNPQKMAIEPVPICNRNPAVMIRRGLCHRCGTCREVCFIQAKADASGLKFKDAPCVHCGQCTVYCPERALTEQFHFPAVHQLMKQREKATDGTAKKTFVAVIAPAVRVALGEMFGMRPGTDVEGKLVTGLRKLGFDYVFDVTFAADLTIMEEAAELLERLGNPEKASSRTTKFPVFTSCCPAWVKYAEYFYPELLPNISTAKSPIQMQGALVKTWFAKEKNLAPEDIVVVAITPCTAKKFEVSRPEMNAAGRSMTPEKPEVRDVDFALTTREAGWWLRECRISLPELKDGACDALMPRGSGAGVIFGSTGGVTEAALRTLYHRVTGENPPDDFLRFHAVRGLQSIKVAEAKIGDMPLKVGVVHGIPAAEVFLQKCTKMPQDAPGRLDFVEVMACPGGCIGGGGQPLPMMSVPELLAARMKGLYAKDSADKVRLSYENPDVKQVYDDFLGQPLSEKSEMLLHTRYTKREE